MKKYLIAIILFLFTTAFAHAGTLVIKKKAGGSGIVSVQTVTAIATDSTGTTISIASTAGGSFIFVALASGTTGTPTITDNNTQSWTVVQQNDDHVGYNTWYLYNVAAGTTSIALAYDYCNAHIIIREYSGVLSSGDPLDKTSYNYSGYVGSGSWTSNATATTTQTDELLIGVSIESAGNTDPAWTPGSGWSTVGSASNNAKALYMEDRIVSSSGAYEADGTYSPAGSDYYQTGIATFKGL